LNGKRHLSSKETVCTRVIQPVDSGEFHHYLVKRFLGGFVSLAWALNL